MTAGEEVPSYQTPHAFYRNTLRLRAGSSNNFLEKNDQAVQEANARPSEITKEQILEQEI